MKHILNNLRNLKIHEILFYVFLFFIPFQTRIIYRPIEAYIGSNFNYHLGFFVYLTDLIWIVCLFAYILFDRRGFYVKRIFWLILAFFIANLVSMFNVKHLDLALYKALISLLSLILVLYIGVVFRTKRQFFTAGWVIFVSSILQAIIGLWQFHVQHGLNLAFLGEYIAPLGTSGLSTIDYGTEKLIRAYGTFPHPNVLAGFLVFGLVMGFFLVSRATNTISNQVRDPLKKGFLANRSKWAAKILVSCGTIILTAGIFVTFSRQAWLATAIVYLSFMIYYLTQKTWKKSLLIALIAIVSCGTILFTWNNYLQARVFNADSRATSDRVSFNRLGIQLWTKHPILGVGVGNYVPALQELKKLDDWQYQPPHNILIFTAAELGMVGLILFALLVQEIFLQLKNVPRGTIKFSFMLLAVIVLLLGQFDHYFVTIEQGRLMFWTILGLLTAIPNLNEPDPQS